MIRQAIQSELGEGDGRVYRLISGHMTMALRRVVNVANADSVSYLRPIADLARTRGLTVATLNYDRALELACQAAGVPVSTGIESWAESSQLKPPASGLYLLKLHGSIDWSIQNLSSGARVRYSEGGPVELTFPRHSPDGTLPQTHIAVSDDPVGDRRPPGIIFGQRGKLRAEGPFLELLAEFDRALSESERLVVVGYSFRDDHVNELIRKWVNGDRRRHIVVVDPGFPDGRGWAKDDFRQEMLNNLVPLKRPPPTPKHFDPRMTVLREPASSGVFKAIQALA